MSITLTVLSKNIRSNHNFHNKVLDIVIWNLCLPNPILCKPSHSNKRLILGLIHFSKIKKLIALPKTLKIQQ